MNRPGIVIFSFMILLTSCEKEKDFGKALYSGDEMINYLSWSENGSEIYFGVDRPNYIRTIYGVDVSSGDSRRIGEVTASYGNLVFPANGKIFYFNDLEYMNTKLFSLAASGGTAELIIDSLQSPVFSKKYIAFLKSYFLPDTSFTNTILYDLDYGTETPILPDRNYSPVSISPDGSRLLLRWWTWENYQSYYAIYNTESGQVNDLSVSSVLYLYNYFWRDDEVYAFTDAGLGTISIIKMATGQKVSYSESLTWDHYYAVSPSGSIMAYVVTEYPALAGGIVGNHYFLHIIREGTADKTVIDMERDYVYEGLVTFSPDETRIAYVRDDTDIYVLTIN